jgi:hypothetical protein
MTVYSNASYSPESGDVSGYEVALAQGTTGTRALLFVYEGAPNETEIELTGENTGQKLILSGIWTEHLIEYPIGGLLDPAHSDTGRHHDDGPLCRAGYFPAHRGAESIVAS